MSTDATQVTGSPLASGSPKPGDVLAERYELLEIVEMDGPAVGYRALDQESERPVLVRVLAGSGLHTDECDRVVDRLRRLVGVGGRYLASLLDADREGRSPFTVEAWPRGTQLSSILDARRAKGRALGAREALPVVSQLAAALEALPDGVHHGEVRAERVWLDTDGLRLTGPFLLASLPPEELGERVREIGPGGVTYAPEMKTGETSEAGDHWGVAAIAWEALTGRSPEPTAHAPEVGGPLRDVLASLLTDAPERRPRLDGLVGAVAADAGLPAPTLDPEPNRPAIVAEGTQPAAAPPRRRAIPGAAAEGTQEIAFEDIIEDEAPGESDTARHAAVRPDEPDSLDPRLVRAALGVTMDSVSEDQSVDEPSVDGLDPRLVRAALGVELEDSAVQELSSEELELEAPPKPRPLPAPRPRPASRPPAPKPRAKAPGPRPKAPAPKPRAAPAPKPRAAPAPKPRAAAPAPRPRAAKPGAPAARPAPSPRPAPKAHASAPPPQPRPTPAPQPAPPRSSPPTPEAPAPVRGLAPEEGGTAIVPRDLPPRSVRRPAAKPQNRAAGIVIVAVALIVAMGIVGIGFLIAGQRRSEAARQRRNDERMQQLRQEDHPATPEGR